jgi:hypothetical protein
MIPLGSPFCYRPTEPQITDEGMQKFRILGGLSNPCRPLLISFYLRGFGHTGLRHFFRDAGKKCFVRFFFGSRFCHTCHDVIKPEVMMFTLEQERSGFFTNAIRQTDTTAGQ